MHLKAERTDYIFGSADVLQAVAANYQCGHCNSYTKLLRDPLGNPHVATFHDDGCPVLTGHISSIPDTFRAATGLQP